MMINKSHHLGKLVINPPLLAVHVVTSIKLSACMPLKKKLHYSKILLLFWTSSFLFHCISPALKPFNVKKSVKISYLITAFQRQPQPQKIDLREVGENLCMLKQSPTCQLSPLLCALKKYLTSYKGNKFIMEGDVVSNSVCASLTSSALMVPWAQHSPPVLQKEESVLN